MAKRFTDTDKWKKPFIRSMKAPYKLLWIYLMDECSHAGIWDVDFETAQIKIGEKLDREKALNFFGDRVLEFDGGTKWFVYGFIDFQYGDLNPTNRAHNSVLTILNKYSIDWQNKPLTSPLQGAKDKDMDKDMDMDKVKDKEAVYRKFKHLSLSLTEFDKLVNMGYRQDQIDGILNAIENYRMNTKYTSLFLTSIQWMRKEFKAKANKVESFLEQDQIARTL